MAYFKLIEYINTLGSFILKNLNRVVFLVPSMYSNVEMEDEFIKKGKDKEDIELLRSKQCLSLLNKLNKLFWDERWKYKTNDDGKPLLLKISYGGYEKDVRYLCIFYKEGDESSNYFDKIKMSKNVLELIYRRTLFMTSWNEASKSVTSKLAVEGSHHAENVQMFELVKHLNLKCDTTDIILDIGYGTGLVLASFATMLQTRVYGSEISEPVFDTTVSTTQKRLIKKVSCTIDDDNE